eukprot:365486-Chlamydomonas_euryale.AAC.13
MAQRPLMQMEKDRASAYTGSVTVQSVGQGLPHAFQPMLGVPHTLQAILGTHQRLKSTAHA